MRFPARDRLADLLETGFIVAATFLVLEILVLARQRLNIKADTLIEPAWLVVALIPFLAWLVVSGRLTEFSAGSVSAKLATISAESVAKAIGEADIGPQTITEMALSAPDAQLDEAVKQKPVMLKLKLGVEGYTDQGIQKWVATLLEKGRLEYVAFLDPDERLVSYVGARNLLAYLAAGKQISERIQTWYVPRIPEMRDDRLQLATTNQAAMDYLTKERRNDVAVVDEHGRLQGLLRLADIVKRYVEYLGLQGAGK